ncbi:hypothetical protein ABZP36_007883 [Zizania latifolia]
MAPPLLLVLFLLPALAAGHQHPSTYGSSALTEWRPAKASYYAADPEDAIGVWIRREKGSNMKLVKCLREGGVRFSVNGQSFFLTVLISNVGGAGDVRAVKVKGTESGWLSMGRNWGQIWHINTDFRGQPLSFELTSSDGTPLTNFNVVPKDWDFGKTYTGKQFPL